MADLNVLPSGKTLDLTIASVKCYGTITVITLTSGDVLEVERETRSRSQQSYEKVTVSVNGTVASITEH